VGLKKANAWGLCDMAGNVSEWVIDAYAADHYKQFAGKTVNWKDAIAWPKAAFPHVVKGGNWDADPEDCRSASRLASSPQWQKNDPQLPKSVWWYTHAFHVGFRIVRPLKEPSKAEKLRYWAAGAEEIEDVLRTGDRQKRALIKKVKDGKP
jgi:formylglycine-generating enzyme required for sulfatase activity